MSEEEKVHSPSPIKKASIGWFIASLLLLLSIAIVLPQTNGMWYIAEVKIILGASALLWLAGLILVKVDRRKILAKLSLFGSFLIVGIFYFESLSIHSLHLDGATKVVIEELEEPAHRLEITDPAVLNTFADYGDKGAFVSLWTCKGSCPEPTYRVTFHFVEKEPVEFISWGFGRFGQKGRMWTLFYPEKQGFYGFFKSLLETSSEKEKPE